MHFIRYHERRVKSKSKVADHIVFCRLIFIFLKELGCTGKCDLGDVFFYLICCHTDTVIDEFQCLLFRIDHNVNLRLVILRHAVFAHHIQLFQLCNGVASVWNHLTEENVMVWIHPLLYNRKNIFTADGKTSFFYWHDNHSFIIYRAGGALLLMALSAPPAYLLFTSNSNLNTRIWKSQ